MQKSIELYNKGGNTAFALQLCFQMEKDLPTNSPQAARSKSSVAVFDMINSIVKTLDTKTSPKVLERCAEFLISHKQFDRAMELYIVAKKYIAAIDMCSKHKITITESILTRLIPEAPGSAAGDSPGDPPSSGTVSENGSSDSGRNAGKDAEQRKEVLALLASTLRDQVCVY